MELYLIHGNTKAAAEISKMVDSKTNTHNVSWGLSWTCHSDFFVKNHIKILGEEKK